MLLVLEGRSARGFRAGWVGLASAVLAAAMLPGVLGGGALAQEEDEDPTTAAAEGQETGEGAADEGDAADDGEAAGDDAATEEAQVVHVGVYVNQVPSIRLKENEYSVDFWVWFRWKSDAINPMDSFELVNGRIDSKDEPYRAELPDGHYATTRVTATITKFWDVSRFPLDNHTLDIAIEDGDNEEFKLKYVADEQNSGTSPEVQVPGWERRPGKAGVAPHRYQTNYGDTSLPTNSESVYSRFVYRIPLERAGYGFFLKLFFGLFVATAISFMAFYIKPTDVDPRFGLGIGAIFAAVASEYVITSSLPDTNVMTMADKLHILAFVFIFLSIAESTYSLYLYSSDDEAKVKRSIRLDRASFFILGALYIAGSAWAVMGT
jgi:hypothetical protein